MIQSIRLGIGLKWKQKKIVKKTCDLIFLSDVFEKGRNVSLKIMGYVRVISWSNQA